MKKTPANKKVQYPDNFSGEFYQTHKGEHTDPSQSIPNIESTLKFILWSHHYPATKTRQRHCQKENYSPTYLINIEVKNPQQNIINQIQQHTSKDIHLDEIGYTPG